MRLASFRRFWAVAAKRNSSLAPLGPRRRNRSSLAVAQGWPQTAAGVFSDSGLCPRACPDGSTAVGARCVARAGQGFRGAPLGTIPPFPEFSHELGAGESGTGLWIKCTNDRS